MVALGLFCPPEKERGYESQDPETWDSTSNFGDLVVRLMHGDCGVDDDEQLANGGIVFSDGPRSM